MFWEGLPKTITSDPFLTCCSWCKFTCFDRDQLQMSNLTQIRSQESITFPCLSGKYSLWPYFTGCDTRCGVSERFKSSRVLRWSCFQFASTQKAVLAHIYDVVSDSKTAQTCFSVIEKSFEDVSMAIFFYTCMESKHIFYSLSQTHRLTGSWMLLDTQGSTIQCRDLRVVHTGSSVSLYDLQ